MVGSFGGGRARLLVVAVVVVASLALAATAGAKTIQVPKQHPTIQAAVDAASEGDTIKVTKAKRYRENVEVTTNNLTIVGALKSKKPKGKKKGKKKKAPKGEVIVDGGPGASDPVFDITANNFRLEKLTMLQGGGGASCVGAGCKFIKVKVRTGDASSADCINVVGNGMQVRESRLLTCGGDNGLDFDSDNYRVEDNLIRLADNECVKSDDGNKGIVSGNVIHNCEDNEGLALTGDKNRITGNVMRASDESGINLSGDDNLVESNFMTNIEDYCLEADGDRNKFRKNEIAGCYDQAYYITGNGVQVIKNKALAVTDDDCYYVDGVNPRVEGNRADICDGGFEVTGENPKVIGNVATRSGDDDAFEIDCQDETGGAPAAQACSAGVVSNNRGSGVNNDDEGFDIGVTSGTGAGFRITGNIARENNDGGFDIDVNDAVISGNSSFVDGAEGNEPAFEIDGSDNEVTKNTAAEGGETGFEIGGSDNVLVKNVARLMTSDGILVENGTGNILRSNTATDNGVDGIQNGSGVTGTILRDNTARGNRTDCANDGTIAVNAGNKCADGSNFNEPGS